jgi:hypothetical protein
MSSTERQTHRRAFIDAWARALADHPLGPVEAQIVQVARMHPEYQGCLTDADRSLDRDFPPEAGQGNPFLHMGLHIAILEQLTADQPAGIRSLHQRLVAATGDVHAADHRLMECLAAGLWRVQRDRKPFNEKAYLKCIKRAGGPIRPRVQAAPP